MMPSANSAKVKSPASGRSASAASVAELMLVTPLAFSTAAVVRMMKKAMPFESSMPSDGVGPDARELGISAALGLLAQRPVALALVHLLDLLGGLPEEQIGADGGAEHGDHHHEIIGVDGRLRPHCGDQRRAPWDVHGEGGRDIGEQRQRQEFQHRRIAAVGQEDLEDGRAGREDQRMLVVEPADHQRERLRHRGDVGGDVEGVGGNEQRDEPHHPPARRDLA